MKKLIMTVCASALLIACGVTGMGTNGGKQPSLVNTKWQLADQVKGKTPTLNIENGKITGNGGCNNYFGNLTADEATGSFSAGSIGATKMACPNMDAEQAFFGMLPKANKYRVSGNSLELYKDGLLLLKFSKVQ